MSGAKMLIIVDYDNEEEESVVIVADRKKFK